MKNKKKLSICIPTFNRIHLLDNCLNSIKIASSKSNLNIEVCISDNHSNEKINKVVNNYEDKLDIKFNRNDKNLGLVVNILKSVSLASGEFAWIIGNDDLLTENCLSEVEKLFNLNNEIDFFYINSFHLKYSKIKNYEIPFDTKNLKDFKMKKFSNFNTSKKMNFHNLINPNISFDFLLGMFLCIFRKKYWDQNLDVIDNKLISDLKTYSSFDNTCPHIKIWSKAFKNKSAYFQSNPLTVNLSGERAKDWGYLYPFVEAIRIPEVVDCFRENGLSFMRYIYCKNYAVRKLLFNLVKLLINPSYKGLAYVKIKKHIINNLIYPSIYIAPIFYIFRKILKITKIINK